MRVWWAHSGELLRTIDENGQLPSAVHFSTDDRSARVMVVAALAQVLLGSRRDEFFPSVSATGWREPPLLSHHRLTPDELHFVHDRAVDWPEELRLRILHDLPERAVSDDWKIPRCRADSLLTNSHI